MGSSSSQRRRSPGTSGKARATAGANAKAKATRVDHRAARRPPGGARWRGAGAGADAKAEANAEAAAGAGAELKPDASRSPSWIEPLLSRARRNGKARAAALRIQHPDATPLQLAQRLVSGAAFKAGLWGAATGTLAIITLPVGLPAGVALTLLLEAELLFALLAIYGFSSAGEVGRVRLFALWAGSGFASAATNAGLKVGANAVSRALAGSLPARLIARINPVLLKAILKRLGLSWLPRAFKLWPVIGAPIGFMLDRAALRALGAQAVEALERAPRPKGRTASGS